MVRDIPTVQRGVCDTLQKPRGRYLRGVDHFIVAMSAIEVRVVGGMLWLMQQRQEGRAGMVIHRTTHAHDRYTTQHKQ